jgi:hypothetical protein
VKELAARFRAINPRTHFDPTRAQKWFQGRATPRSLELYDDWAKVLGISKSGAWLEATTLEEFVAEIASTCRIDARELLDRAGAHLFGDLPKQPDPAGALSYLAGNYSCYSAAWCPYYKGRIIRGAIKLTWRSGAISAEYTEAFLGQTVHFRGTAFVVGRALHLDVRKAGTGEPLFGSFILPGPPASLLCGMVAGATVVGPDPQPSATRMLMVRVAVGPDTSNRYLEPGETVSSDLAAAGVRISEVEESVVQDFLQPGGYPALDQVLTHDHVRLSKIFDKFFLSGSQPVASDKLDLPEAAAPG